MNRVTLIGTLCNDVEKKTSQSGNAFASFRLAVRRKFKNPDGKYDCDFINCKTFKATAEYLARVAVKGDKVAVEGSIQTGSYEKKDGSKVYTTDVMVENLEVFKAKPKEEKDGFVEVKDEQLPWEV